MVGGGNGMGVCIHDLEVFIGSMVETFGGGGVCDEHLSYV